MPASDREGSSRFLWTHLRGHLLVFDRKAIPDLTAEAGLRLLIVAALLELLRLAAVRALYPGIPLLLLLLSLLVAGLLMVRRIARLTLVQLGFRPWRLWTTTEKSYFLQVLVIANVVFPMILATRTSDRAPQSLASGLWGVFVPYLVFGFYQELVYRGMVQLALARRWGAPIGILVANVFYTFGPLHSYYFLAPASHAAPMFAAIFAIGLLFGILYERSGNLWIVAVFHAIGNAYIVWGMGSVR